MHCALNRANTVCIVVAVLLHLFDMSLLIMNQMKTKHKLEYDQHAQNFLDETNQNCPGRLKLCPFQD